MGYYPKKTATLDLFEEAPVAYLVLSGAGEIRRVNRRAVSLLGDRAVVGSSLEEQLGDESLLVLGVHLEGVLSADGDTGRSTELELRDGRLVYASSCRLDELVLMTLEDVSEQRAAERRLQSMAGQLRATNARLAELAHIDPLTRQGNRRAIGRALVNEAARVQRSGSSLLAVLIDCDDFKAINDRYGHAGGDVVLQAVARRLRGALRPTDHLGRIGGDEFLVLLPETSYAEGLQISERLREAVSRRPIELHQESVEMTASIGVAAVPSACDALDEVISLTGLSLKRSKRRGKNRVSANAALTTRRPARSKARAVERLRAGEGLHAICQPIFDLGDRRLVGFELLSRSDEPDYEMPGDFFRAPDGDTARFQIDLHCLRNCAASASRLPGVRKHLNLLPGTLVSEPTEVVLDVLRRSGDPSDFVIELSEQQMVGDPLALREPVRKLREAGVIVAIDDVGFGKSSLEALILLEPSLVKIDRRFTRGLVEAPGSRQSLARLVNVLRALEISSVAMGIEAAEELSAVGALGIPAGQGYLLGLPSRLETWSDEPLASQSGLGVESATSSSPGLN